MTFPGTEKCICDDSDLSEEILPNAVSTKNNVKSSHTLYSIENWTFLNSDLRINERIEHYKYSIEEAERRLQNKDVIIKILQNELHKIECMCKNECDNTENYRLKYRVALNELESLKQILSKYKDNFEKLIQINKDLVSKDDLLHSQIEVQTWKQLYEELSRKRNTENDQKDTQTCLANTNIEQNLDALKEKCSGIENLLQMQNKKVEDLLVKLVKEFEVNKEGVTGTSNVDDIFNVITNETATQNKNLQMILDENKSIAKELLSLKEEILKCRSVDVAKQVKESSNQTELNSEKTASKSCSRCKCGCKNEVSKEVQTEHSKSERDLLDRVEELGKTATQSNQTNENIIKNLSQTIKALEDDKLKCTAKYEELLKRNLRDTSELQNKTIELNKNIEEKKILLDKISELQVLVEECKCSNGTKLEEFRQMQELLQQYKEQVEFKKLENEKLRKREQELEADLKKREYDTEKCKECATKLTSKNSDFIELQRKYDELCKRSMENECQRLEEKQDVVNLLEIKDKEIEELQSKTHTLHNDLDNAQNEVKKIETVNDRSLTEISCLYRNKESEWFKIASKYEEQTNCLQNLQEENSNLKQQLRELERKLGVYHDDDVICRKCMFPKSCDKTELWCLLQNVKSTLMNLLQKCEDTSHVAADDFLCHPHQLISVLGGRKYVEVTNKTNYLDAVNNLVTKNCSCSVTSETQSEQASDYETKSNVTDSSCKDFYLCTAMTQMLASLEKLKKDLKNIPLPLSKETCTDCKIFSEDVDVKNSSESGSQSTLVPVVTENKLHTIEEINENQLSIL
ncbi:hypothetical protein FQR65_LT08998 [Abscondita terminalis]|nr:hypothetical protein FQR65_LT08998 [Abscondita terminalis]